MNNAREDEGDLNAFGKGIATILKKRGMDISDLSDSFPVTDDDVRENLYDKPIPSRDFFDLLVEKLKLKKDQVCNLEEALKESVLKVA